MIDIHTHLLPGLDDGAQDWEQAIGLARAAAADGIDTAIVTPHHANGSYYNEASVVNEAVASFNERMAAEGIRFVVHAGQEIRVHDDLLEAWGRGELLTLAGTRYMLLEMPSTRIPSGMWDLLHELRLMGLSPIIAHPERNAEVIRHPERLRAMLEAGAYAQVTTHSLLGLFGSRIEQAAWQLCQEGLIQLVSSDAHHVELRGFRMAEAYERIRQRLGSLTEKVLQNNAQAVLEGAPIALLDAIPTETKWWQRVSSLFRK